MKWPNAAKITGT